MTIKLKFTDVNNNKGSKYWMNELNLNLNKILLEVRSI